MYSSSQRSLDLCPLERLSSNASVTVSLSTDSLLQLAVAVRVLVKGYKNIDWDPVPTSLSNSRPAYQSKTSIKPVISRVRYFPPSLLHHVTDSILVRVETRNGSNCLCSLISIQQPTCPFYDDIR